MTANSILMARMASEFSEAVKQIRARAAEAEKDSLQSAFAAILDGDVAGRDLSCEKAGNIPQITRDAICEAARRIGRRYGLSEDEMARHIDRLTSQ